MDIGFINIDKNTGTGNDTVILKASSQNITDQKKTITLRISLDSNSQIYKDIIVNQGPAPTNYITFSGNGSINVVSGLNKTFQINNLFFGIKVEIPDYEPLYSGYLFNIDWQHTVNSEETFTSVSPVNSSEALLSSLNATITGFYLQHNSMAFPGLEGNNMLVSNGGAFLNKITLHIGAESYSPDVDSVHWNINYQQQLELPFKESLGKTFKLSDLQNMTMDGGLSFTVEIAS